MNTELTFDVESLTLADIEDFEDVAGIPISALSVGAGVPTKALTAFAWIITRRTQPGMTLADAREMKLSEVLVLLGGGPASPTEAGAESNISAPSSISTAA
jgi:hypothetical protein